MPYEFNLGNDATEAAKNICCVKHRTVTRWFLKFSGFIQVTRNSRLGMPKQGHC